MNIADIVISLNGRDGGKRFIVIETDEQYSLIADGKGRRLEKPKRKKNKHLKPEGKASEEITKALKAGEKVTNNDLRRELARYIEDRSKAEEQISKDIPKEAKGGVPGNAKR